ncbi:MAG: hypothetical protein U0872_12240 [Planctomycetaceae bacterium]
MNSTLREMTFRSEPAQNLRRQARLFGMKTLAEDALDKALLGKTSLLEVSKLMKEQVRFPPAPWSSGVPSMETEILSYAKFPL